MFDGDRAELRAMGQLETTLQQVADELAMWRHRALNAERELETLREAAGAQAPSNGGQLSELVAQNRRLSERVSVARERIGDLVQQLTFLEQQAGEGGSS